MDIVAILLGIILVNDHVLHRYPEIFPATLPSAVRLRLLSLAGLALAVAAIPCWWAETRLLAALDLQETGLMSRVMITATIAWILAALLTKAASVPAGSLDRCRNLAAFNAAGASIALVIARPPHGALEALLGASAAAILFVMLAHVTDGLHTRVSAADLPRPVRGTTMAVLTAALVTLAFAGLEGVWRG